MDKEELRTRLSKLSKKQLITILIELEGETTVAYDKAEIDIKYAISERKLSPYQILGGLEAEIKHFGKLIRNPYFIDSDMVITSSTEE